MDCIPTARGQVRRASRLRDALDLATHCGAQARRQGSYAGKAGGTTGRPYRKLSKDGERGADGDGRKRCS